MVRDFTLLLPRLAEAGYRITSPPTKDYNCIAWAAGDETTWWWPDAEPNDDTAFWPASVPRERTMAAFVAAFATLGYSPCDSADVDPGYEKIALFADLNGTPTHAARQLPDGLWTSKLGRSVDIEHALSGVVGNLYGEIALILKRPTPNCG